MAQQTQIGSHKTSVFTEDGLTKVVYHHTAVVKFNADIITLDSGGWFTNTTKTRMNQASSQFDLGFIVYQKDFDWYVKFEGQGIDTDFYDGITFDRRFEPVQQVY